MMAKQLPQPPKLSTAEKARIAADPVAALIGYVSTILAAFGLFELMGLTADQVTIVGGAALGVAGTVRTMLEHQRRKDVEALAKENEALRKTPVAPAEAPTKKDAPPEG